MATIYHRGASAYLCWREGGKLRRESLGPITPREAEAARLAKEYQLKTGLILPVASGLPLFRDFAEEYLGWYESEYPATQKHIQYLVRAQLIPAFGYQPIDRLSLQSVSAYKQKRSREVKPDSVNKELRTLKAMLNRAVEWEILKASPIAAAKGVRNLNDRPPPFYTVPQLAKLYAASGSRAPVYRLMVNTGMRRGEALNLRRDHVLSDRIRILSEEGARTKSGKWREVPLNEAAGQALELLPGADYILPRWNPGYMSKKYGECSDRAGVGGSMHWLRHTFCSHLVMAGTSLRTVQVLAGHSTPVVTQRYAHLSPDHLKGAMQGLSL